MRLTASGFAVFSTVLDLAQYEWAILDADTINQRVILTLDRKLRMPYYITTVKNIPCKIVFFGSEEAVWINLYGNLQKFLASYSLDN